MTAYLISIFGAGLLSFFAPCSFPMLTAYAGMVAENQKRRVLSSLFYVLGLSTTFVLLGVSIGGLGALIQSTGFKVVSGALIAVLGARQLGWLQFSLGQKEARLSIDLTRVNGFLKPYVIGLMFSLSWTPCIGPILAGVLLLITSSGGALAGGLYMLVYAIGFALPFLVIGFFSDRLFKRFEGVSRHFETIGGYLLILMGLLVMFDKLNLIVAWLERIG